MNRLKRLLPFLCLLILFGFESKAQQVDEQALAGFMQKRFGLFIHWGPVSLRGTEIGWSRGHQVPTDEYDRLYKEFNPVLFDADKIVAVAQAAGMGYLTITAKHHDGFCLWPSAFTTYDIAATPYKKDIVGALAKACKKVGMDFCIYYSVCDWFHPDYPIHRSGDKELDSASDISKYLVYMKSQLKELIKRYDPSMIWFDGAWESPWTEDMGREVYGFLKEIKPSLIVNNRLGKEIAALANKEIDVSKMIGDFDTPEQVVGRYNRDLPWESCFTLCKQWSWKANDEMKPLKQCLDIISKTAGGNGNLLLNIGPMPDGRVELRQLERLQGIGNWMRINGEAIYGTVGGPYVPNEDYAMTQRNGTLYLHVLNTEKPEIVLPDFEFGKLSKAQILDGVPLRFEVKDNDLVLLLPAERKGTEEPFLDHSKTLLTVFTTTPLNVSNPLYNSSLPFKNQGASMELQNNLNLIYDILPKLRFNAGFQISKAMSEVDMYTSPDNTQFVSTPFQQRGRYTNGTSERLNLNSSALLSYGNVFDGKHSVTANIRGQIAHAENSSETFVAAGFPSGAAPSIRFAYAYLENGMPAASKRAHRSVGATASVNYAFKMRYLFDASYRIDGSTSFGKDNLFSPYWSTGIGWNIHQEEFLKGNRFLTRLKLFSNIGITGNQNMGSVLSSSVYSYLKTYNQTGQGVGLSIKGNPTVLPQKTTQVSSGFDFGFFSDRVTGTFNTYYKKTTDMVVPIDYPTSSGVKDYPENVGSLITSGYELRFSFAPIDRKAQRIVWRVNLTGATLNTKYADFGNAMETKNTQQEKSKSLVRYKDGYSPYDIWAARSLGIDPATGREMFLTEDNLHTLDYNSANIVVVGSTKPLLEGVVTNAVNYKNLSLSVMMRYKTKADVFNRALLDKVENISYQSVAYNQDKRALYDRWKTPGDVSQFKSISLTTMTEISTRFIQEENVLSCESISLGYTVSNQNWMKPLGFRTIHVAGYTNDIFRLSSVKRERGTNYPFARSVSFSVRVSF